VLHKPRSISALAVLLAALSMIGPFAIDTYLPSFPAIQSDLSIIFGAVALNLVYSAWAPPALPWSVLPIMIYTVGMALAMPSLTLLALELFPDNRGLSSSLLGFEHSFLSALVAGGLAPLLSRSAFTLACGMALLATLGCASWMLYWLLNARIRTHEVQSQM
jgi:DHA1 family bicyclomycin/chloramphenicol resistance-like MFS transporter